MGNQETQLQGPDLTLGVSVNELREGVPLLGHAHGLPVVMVKQGEEVFATSAGCSHYGGPLAEGVVEGHSIRCPWHHACFDLRTGVATGAPALNPIACYSVLRSGDSVQVGEQKPPHVAPPIEAPSPVVIIGAGAAGSAAAEMLRREGFKGAITLVGEEDPSPVDRPNLSKDYLAGTAPEEWVYLRDAGFYKEMNIEFIQGDAALSIDTKAQAVTLRSGRQLHYQRLVLATGAEPIRLPIPGAELPHVHTLRTLTDSKAIMTLAQSGRTAVIIGASFIGLEAAAALRTRGVNVHVVGLEQVPLERVFGAEVGRYIQSLHEEHGVTFHLGTSAKAIHRDRVELANGETLNANFVVMGVGVKPRVGLAEKAGIETGNGIVVNDRFETSARHVYAVGDVASYPDPRTGDRIRVEHWVAAQREGQAVARFLLSRATEFNDAPFFWSQHYDVGLSVVGHAAKWDKVEIKGSLQDRDATVIYSLKGQPLLVLTVGRDQASLRAEIAMEQNDRKALEKALA